MRRLSVLSVLVLAAGCSIGGTSEKAAPLPTISLPSDTTSPRLTAAQQRFASAVRTASDKYGDDSDATLVQYGRDFCGIGAKDDNPYTDFGGNPPRVEGIATYKSQLGELEKLAVVHLCPKYTKVWKQAMAGFQDGDHKVGKDIKPGRYRTLDKGLKSCYWERTAKNGDRLDNQFVTYAAGHVEVTIQPTDGGFSSKKCSFWVPAS
ncbi:hypothetical protein [Nonomuraea sp. NPDC003804]|uniref:hypothetical protein n=1 Tax=Nonomuraea sp. NPDC003804 TaxID=3154547 RepID=UPI0033B20B54